MRQNDSPRLLYLIRLAASLFGQMLDFEILIFCLSNHFFLFKVKSVVKENHMARLAEFIPMHVCRRTRTDAWVGDRIFDSENLHLLSLFLFLFPLILIIDYCFHSGDIISVEIKLFSECLLCILLVLFTLRKCR